MKHFAATGFWKRYGSLPPAVRGTADKCFRIMKQDPRHPSIALKKVGRYYAARVGLHYRALALETADGLVWFWIGSHAEYDQIITRD